MISEWADRCATRWTAWYTRGLATPVAERRREEIASDLFEQAAACGRGHAQQRNVLGRVLWGIPADLSWRRAARASQPRRRKWGAPMKLQRTITIVVGALVLFMLWAGTGTLRGDGAEIRYTLPFLAAAVLLCIGLAQWNTRPRLSAVLILVGAAAPMAIFYWMAPAFFLPFVAVAVLVFVAQRRRRPVEGRRRLVVRQPCPGRGAGGKTARPAGDHHHAERHTGDEARQYPRPRRARASL
jgi:hypothetical protein